MAAMDDTSIRAELRECLLRAVRRSCATSIARYADDIVRSAIARLEAEGGFDVDAGYRAKLAYAATIEAIRESREPIVEGERRPAPAEEPELGTGDRFRRVTAPPDTSQTAEIR